MARESKRKRDERRFGKPERLADLILNTPPEGWVLLPHMRRNLGEMAPVVAEIQGDVARAQVIVADNVSDYFFDHEQNYWVYKRDFPCVAPPWPTFFVEMRRPPRVRYEGDKVYVPGPECPTRTGILFDAVPAEGKRFLKPGAPGEVFDIRVKGARSVHVEGAEWFIRALPIWHSVAGGPSYLPFLKYFAVDKAGLILEDPSSIYGDLAGGLEVSHDVIKDIDFQVCQYLMPALLAISFINCKNTRLDPVDPSAEVNAARRKAGLRPFVRYHTIDIEPMKAVLRTEGGIESNGLKKALHIVRGHFATYTPERPLFGKVAGTFWMPAHVRGTAKQGVVVKDYRVNAPKSQETTR